MLCKLGLQLSPDAIRGVAKSHPWVIENVLIRVRDKIDDYLVHNGNQVRVQTRLTWNGAAKLKGLEQKPHLTVVLPSVD